MESTLQNRKGSVEEQKALLAEGAAKDIPGPERKLTADEALQLVSIYYHTI